MENNGVFCGISLLETGILSVLFEKGIVTPEEFKRSLFNKVDEVGREEDKQTTKDFISTKIENALKLKIE
ncbi:hypothetical protein ACSXAR_06785 [Clostridium perfringens]|nr:hypothetical protein [Clostridium perfringens]